MKRSLLAVLSVVVLFAACVSDRKEEGKRAERSTAAVKNFSLKDLDGKPVSLASLKGKIVLLEFWATWCPPCRSSIPGTEKLYETYHARGFEVLGISLDSDDWDSVKAFRTEYKITYRVLEGSDEVAEQFGVRSIPMFILLDRDGQQVREPYFGSGNEKAIEQEIKKLLAG